MQRPPVRLPNFFILGAGRCGTTALALALNQHPEVFIPAIKEPSFFASSFQWVKDPARYIALYEPGTDASAVGDASHIYLEDPESPRILQSFSPTPDLCSCFGTRLTVHSASMRTCSRAVTRPAVRSSGLWPLRIVGFTASGSAGTAHSPSGTTCISALGSSASRYSVTTSTSTVTGSGSRPLAAWSTSQLRRCGHCTSFSRSSPSTSTCFPDDRSSKGTRSIAVQDAERRVLRPLARRTGDAGESIRTRVNRWNRGADKPTMDPETRTWLHERFEPDLRLLRDLSGIDLTAGVAR